MRLDELPFGMDPPSTLRRREQVLAKRLLVEGLLVPPAGAEPAEFGAHSWSNGRVMADTRLSEDTAATVLQRKGSPRDRCRLIALIDATLGWNGPDRRDILRVL